jgi:putative NADH-flavin reductase
MKIVIFGASGGTGQELVKQALAQGHEVTAFVRDPAKCPERERVRVVQGDVLDASAVATAIEGQEAVLSALGSRTLGKSDLLARASANILAGMHAYGVRRLIVLGAAGALRSSLKHQGMGRKMFFWLISHTMLKEPLADSAAQQKLIEASDVEYTIVLPPRLLDTPATGKYQVQTDGLPRSSFQIARADVAAFMLKQLQDRSFVRAAPYIAY